MVLDGRGFGALHMKKRLHSRRLRVLPGNYPMGSTFCTRDGLELRLFFSQKFRMGLDWCTCTDAALAGAEQRKDWVLLL